MSDILSVQEEWDEEILWLNYQDVWYPGLKTSGNDLEWRGKNNI